MNLKKYIWTLALAATVGMGGCSNDPDIDPIKTAPLPSTADVPEPPIPDLTPGEVTIKPKAMWIDCHANFLTLSTKDGVQKELDKLEKYGYNLIYLDVKPGNGYALYKSDILPYCDSFADLTVNRDFDDYLGFILEECEKRGIDVVASVGAMGWGYQHKGVKQGLVYDNWNEWGDKVQMRSDTSNPDIIVPITDDPEQAITMLDPMYLEVQDLLVSVCSEIVTKYPKIKGISLDYCRYANNDGGYFGMGDNNMSGFASYWGESVPNHLEIVTATGGVGPKFAKWVEYRSAVVTSVITRVNAAIKAIKPDCELHLWAGADWVGRYLVGQNWASKKYKPSGYQYTDTYNTTGFADQLDVFITGAYSEKVWKKEDPSTIWTVENFCRTWNNYIMGDCKCYGSIAAYALNSDGMSDATYLCLKHTDGYMNFELSHTNNRNLWEASQDGMYRYEGYPADDEETEESAE